MENSPPEAKPPVSESSEPGQSAMLKTARSTKILERPSETFRRKLHVGDGVIETRARCGTLFGKSVIHTPAPLNPLMCKSLVSFWQTGRGGRIVKNMEPLPWLGTGGSNVIQILQGSLGHRSAQPHHCFKFRVACFVGRSHNIQGKRRGGRLRVDCKPNRSLWERHRCLGLESWIRR